MENYMNKLQLHDIEYFMGKLKADPVNMQLIRKIELLVQSYKIYTQTRG